MHKLFLKCAQMFNVLRSKLMVMLKMHVISKRVHRHLNRATFFTSRKTAIVFFKRKHILSFPIALGLITFSFSTISFALSGQAYLEKFQTYLKWNQTMIPNPPSADFLNFIQDDTPLSNRLREKWLYQLAQKHLWADYTHYYRPSNDINLQCYAQMALYQQGQYQQALLGAKPLWLNGQSQAKACDNLFNLLLKDKLINDQWLTERFELALAQRNISLARYLLKQYRPAKLYDVGLLNGIVQNPRLITQLSPGGLHGDLYLFGLKQIALRNMDEAIKYWRQPHTHKMLNEAQQQAFLAHLTLYKAMRNQNDTAQWFAKIKPAFYTDSLLEWEIRYSLKHQQWHQVETLIQQLTKKDEPNWQYWLARAYEAQGDKEKARTIYQSIAVRRHYYGFLASIRLHQHLHFENEKPVTDPQVLVVYKPIMDQIKTLYTTKQMVQASRLLNDFILELPAQEQGALAYWVATELNWPVKALYLSNNDTLTNQLMLRFPLSYQSTVFSHATHRQIPPELVYAIIRQESTFRDDVVSTAGAHGLMQIMPATARKLSKQAHIPYGDKNQLFLPEKNIAFGIAYLQDLAARFHQHPLLMAAAYNAGPRQAYYWAKNHMVTPIDIWIETLPWVETRNYLKNVMAFYAVYQYRMQKKPNLNAFLQPIGSPQHALHQ